MELARDGVEYSRVVFENFPPDPGVVVQASLDRVTWFDFDVAPAPQTDGTWVGKVLLRGPNASSTNGALVNSDSTVLWVRVTDSPEILPMRAGIITFY